MIAPCKYYKRQLFAGKIPKEYLVEIECAGENYCYDIRYLVRRFNENNVVDPACGNKLPLHVIKSIYRRADLLGVAEAAANFEHKPCDIYSNLETRIKGPDFNKVFTSTVDQRDIFQLDCNRYGKTYCYDVNQLAKWIDDGYNVHPDCQLENIYEPLLSDDKKAIKSHVKLRDRRPSKSGFSSPFSI